MSAPSGQQHQLVHGQQRPVIVEVGGGVRTYEVAGRAVLDGYGEHEVATTAAPVAESAARRRVHLGRHDPHGAARRTGQGNALHRLCRYPNWVADRTAMPRASRCGCACMRRAIPVPLDLAVHYRLHDDGLHVQTAATNIGSVDAPYAQGAHPYITLGGVVDDAAVIIPAQTRLVTDEDQVRPAPSRPVARPTSPGRSPD